MELHGSTEMATALAARLTRPRILKFWPSAMELHGSRRGEGGGALRACGEELPLGGQWCLRAAEEPP